MYGLSKSKLTAFRQCPKRLWLETHKPDRARPSSGTRLAMQNGHRIGEAARAQYGGGLLIDPPSLSEALDATQAALAAADRPLFEATFQAAGVLVRVDVLLPEISGARIIEVKGSTSLKDYHVEDAAIQAWVARAAGLRVSRVCVAHVDKNFVYRGDGDYSGLFALNDITTRADELQPAVGTWVTDARATLAGLEPAIASGAQCTKPFECPFRAYCSTSGRDAAEFPLDDFYKLHPQHKESLRAAGYRDVREVPPELVASDLNRRIQQVSIARHPYLDRRAGDRLRAVGYPRRYLDFETILVSVPRWAATRPSMQVPFQWSCHVEHRDGRVEHSAFLAPDGDDPRLAFAETLLAACGDTGPIYAYHAQFESLRLRELAKHLPHLAPQITRLLDRVVDLEDMTRESYYHHAMHGSWSLKRVLPTIAPELDYASLAVSDGNLAQEAYLEMIDVATSHARQAELQGRLLAYCKRDTEALLRIARFLEQADARQL